MRWAPEGRAGSKLRRAVPWRLTFTSGIARRFYVAWSGWGKKTGREGRNETLWVKDPESHNQMRRETERRGRLSLSQPNVVTCRNDGERSKTAPQLSA